MKSAEKLGAVLELGQIQTGMFALFARAEAAKATGDYHAARPAYEQYVTQARAHLQATLAFNQGFPESPYDVRTVAQPLVNALLVFADIVQALGERETAASLRREALDVSRAHLGSAGTAETERGLAASLITEGRFNEAIASLMAVRDLVLAEGDALGVARVTIDLADVLQWLGDYARAKEEIEHAEAIIDAEAGEVCPSQQGAGSALLASMTAILSTGHDPGHAVRAVNLYRAAVEVVYYHGLIAKALREWDEAERSFRAVLPEYRTLGSGEAVEYQLAQIDVKRGRFREARAWIEQTAPLFERGAYRPKRSALQRLWAECLLGLGDERQARVLIDRSIADLTGAHFDPDLLWASQWLRARIDLEGGDTAGALDGFGDALDTVASLRRSPLGYRLDSTFLANKKELFSDAIASAVRVAAAADCCAFIESLKSRTLTAVMSLPAEAVTGDAPLEQRLQRLTRQLDALEYQSYREGWDRARKIAHLDLLRERGDLLERIRIGDPRWRLLSEAAPLDLQELLDQLATRRQAALSLYFEPPDLIGVLLVGGELFVEGTKLDDGLARAIEAHARALQHPRFDPFQFDFSVTHSVRAADLIPASLLTRILEADSLVVVPHGPLHLLPWAGLVHEQRRLFEHVAIGVLPNLTALRAGGDVGPPKRLLRIGVASYPGLERLTDLPSVLGELDDVGSAYANTNVDVCEPLLTEAATESAFRALARSFEGSGNVLHMSCHGTMVPSEPMSSGLLLYDAKVDAAEIARARLPFEEVVLSACSTGWRPQQVEDVVLTADEILGIPAGFLEAGSSSVLVSIPLTEGGVARALTTRYHERRASGDSPLRALQHAQQYMLNEHTTPGAWLGFTLYGSG